MKKGYIEIYTGNGKGKTTAAFGLAIRAAGHNLKVWVGQFVKTMEYGEVVLIRERIPEISIELLGNNSCFINRKPCKEDIEAATIGLKKAEDKMISGEYDIIILDELSIALYFNLLTQKQILDFIEKKPYYVELIITGRYAPDWLMEKADLISTVDETKHYYYEGITPRDGIER